MAKKTKDENYRNADLRAKAAAADLMWALADFVRAMTPEKKETTDGDS